MSMGKNRLEAFSDGVLAIIITIMVLEIKVPHGEGFEALQPLIPVLLSYLLSFIYVGIYWNNHHHLLHTVRQVNGAILWANLHLLFWLSLVPFVTGWLGESHSAPIPTALYGVVLLMSALSFTALEIVIIHAQGEESLLKRAVASKRKEGFSILCYLVAVLSAFRLPWLADALYVLVAIIWLVPDRRIERALRGEAVTAES